MTSNRSLSTTHPEVAAQAHGWDPDTISAGSRKNLDWVCPEGHQWSARVESRTRRSTGCPYCSNNKVLPGFNDLQTIFPEIANEAHLWDPTTLTPGSRRKATWKCTNDHQWEASVFKRTSGGQGCPYCSNQRVQEGFNDLATTHPELAAEADGWDPTTVVAGSNKKMPWKCEHGHKWEAPPNQRTRKNRQNNACPTCGNRIVKDGFNDLATTHPELAAEADGWDPTTVVAGSNKKMPWKCEHGHQWEAVVFSRSHIETGCPICINRSLLVGLNDLKTVHPELAKEADGWDPATVISGSHEKLPWVCEQGHRWSAPVFKRSNYSYGCPSCSNSGYDPNSPGWVYLLHHEEKEMLQIGISNIPEKRLSSHKRGGWEPIDLLGPIDGVTAREIEQGFLKFLALFLQR